MALLIAPKIIGWIELNDSFKKTDDYILKKIDHQEVLEASRYMMKNRQKYRTNRPDLAQEKGRTLLDFSSGSYDVEIPEIIKGLKPGRIIIREDSLLIIIYSGHDRLALKAFPEKVKGEGDSQIVEGLWLIKN